MFQLISRGRAQRCVSCCTKAFLQGQPLLWSLPSDTSPSSQLASLLISDGLERFCCEFWLLIWVIGNTMWKDLPPFGGNAERSTFLFFFFCFYFLSKWGGGGGLLAVSGESRFPGERPPGGRPGLDVLSTVGLPTSSSVSQAYVVTGVFCGRSRVSKRFVI